MISHEFSRIENAFEIICQAAYQSLAIHWYIVKRSDFYTVHQEQVLKLILMLLDFIVIS